MRKISLSTAVAIALFSFATLGTIASAGEPCVGCGSNTPVDGNSVSNWSIGRLSLGTSKGRKSRGLFGSRKRSTGGIFGSRSGATRSTGGIFGSRSSASGQDAAGNGATQYSLFGSGSDGSGSNGSGTYSADSNGSGTGGNGYQYGNGYTDGSGGYGNAGYGNGGYGYGSGGYCPHGSSANGTMCSHCVKQFPSDGWGVPTPNPQRRRPVVYQSMWPERFYGDPAATYPSSAPMVYMPTDTTQLGYSYHQVPRWTRNPGMLPPAPVPSMYHTRGDLRGGAAFGNAAPMFPALQGLHHPHYAGAPNGMMVAPVAGQAMPMQAAPVPVQSPNVAGQAAQTAARPVTYQR